MTDGDDRFAGAAEHYARGRPGYGDDALAYLRERFDLADARVLDLGCGTGQLAVPLAEHAATVVAMDPDAAMLAATRDRAADAGHENVQTLQGSDADLRERLIDDVAPLDLTTMGRSFHWTDERPTLDCLREHTRAGGGVAIVDDVEWLTGGDEPWTGAAYEAVAERVDDLPERYDPASVEYDDPWDELLVERGFADVETATFAVERSWSVDAIVDYVRSLSFCASLREDGRSEVERAVRDRLSEHGDEPFEQTARVEVVSGRVSE